MKFSPERQPDDSQAQQAFCEHIQFLGNALGVPVDIQDAYMADVRDPTLYATGLPDYDANFTRGLTAQKRATFNRLHTAVSSIRSRASGGEGAQAESMSVSSLTSMMSASRVLRALDFVNMRNDFMLNGFPTWATPDLQAYTRKQLRTMLPEIPEIEDGPNLRVASVFQALLEGGHVNLSAENSRLRTTTYAHVRQLEMALLVAEGWNLIAQSDPRRAAKFSERLGDIMQPRAIDPLLEECDKLAAVVEGVPRSDLGSFYRSLRDDLAVRDAHNEPLFRAHTQQLVPSPAPTDTQDARPAPEPAEVESNSSMEAPPDADEARLALDALAALYEARTANLEAVLFPEGATSDEKYRILVDKANQTSRQTPDRQSGPRAIEPQRIYDMIELHARLGGELLVAADILAEPGASFVLSTVYEGGVELVLVESAQKERATYLFVPELLDGDWLEIAGTFNRTDSRVFGAIPINHPPSTEEARPGQHREKILQALTRAHDNVNARRATRNS